MICMLYKHVTRYSTKNNYIRNDVKMLYAQNHLLIRETKSREVTFLHSQSPMHVDMLQNQFKLRKS